jgi:hypothetical protein
MTTPIDSDARIHGRMLMAGAIASTLLAAAHPLPHGHGLAEALRSLADGATFNGWIHGLLLALYLPIGAGLLGLSRRLGLDRPVVALAMIAYGAGAIAFTGAAAINGFAAGLFAARYPTPTPDQIEPVRAALAALGSIARAWAAIGAIAGTAAILFWSIALLGIGGAGRRIGMVGLPVAVVAIVLLASGVPTMNVHGLILLVLLQSLWTVAVGVQMAKGAMGKAG